MVLGDARSRCPGGHVESGCRRAMVYPRRRGGSRCGDRSLVAHRLRVLHSGPRSDASTSGTRSRGAACARLDRQHHLFHCEREPEDGRNASHSRSESVWSGVVSRLWIPAVLAVAVIAGTVADQPRDREPMIAGDYVVLSGDFHLHSGLTSGGSMTPWGLVGEALRQDLDVIAITGHNEAWGGRIARAFSRVAASPIVLVGEEVTSATQDLIAVGIQSTISPHLPLIDQIAEIHRQGRRGDRGASARAFSPGVHRHWRSQRDRWHRGLPCRHVRAAARRRRTD
jgi:hypothetical protein